MGNPSFVLCGVSLAGESSGGPRPLRIEDEMECEFQGR